LNVVSVDQNVGIVLKFDEDEFDPFLERSARHRELRQVKEVVQPCLRGGGEVKH
jgi:hypothetical protein